VVSHVGATIDMNRVSWNVKTGGGILKHIRMFPKDVPIILRDAITCFASANGSNLEWAVNVSIKMCDIEPFPKWQKIVMECKFVRLIRWANEMGLAG
jgi:hypothetical protein